MSYQPAGPGRHATGPAGPAAPGQVTEAGRGLGQEPAPGADQVQVIPSGGANVSGAEFHDASAGDCGDDGPVGCHDSQSLLDRSITSAAGSLRCPAERRVRDSQGIRRSRGLTWRPRARYSRHRHRRSRTRIRLPRRTGETIEVLRSEVAAAAERHAPTVLEIPIAAAVPPLL